MKLRIFDYIYCDTHYDYIYIVTINAHSNFFVSILFF